MSRTFFWRVFGPQKMILPRVKCNVLQATPVIKMISDTWTKKVSWRSSLLSAAANQAQQEGLPLQGSRLLANFNKSMAVYIPVASRDVCERALPDENPSQ